MRDISYKFINKNKFFLPAFFTLFRNYLNTNTYTKNIFIQIIGNLPQNTHKTFFCTTCGFGLLRFYASEKPFFRSSSISRTGR